MNRKMLKEIISNMDMDVVKELDEYGKNKLATLMEGLLIVIRRAKIHHQRLLKVHHF